MGEAGGLQDPGVLGFERNILAGKRIESRHVLQMAGYVAGC